MGAILSGGVDIVVSELTSAGIGVLRTPFCQS